MEQTSSMISIFVYASVTLAIGYIAAEIARKIWKKFAK